MKLFIICMLLSITANATSFEENIKPIFQRNCTQCHPGSVNYRVAVGYKDKLMKKVVRLRQMPPKYQTRLSDAEVQTIKNWLNEGTPK